MKKYLLVFCFLNQFFISYGFVPIFGEDDNSSLFKAQEEQRKKEEARMRSEFIEILKERRFERLSQKGIDFFDVISKGEYEDGLLQLLFSADKYITHFLIQKIEHSRFGFDWSKHLAQKNSNQMNALHYAVLHSRWKELKPFLTKAEKKWIFLSRHKEKLYRDRIQKLFLAQDTQGDTLLHYVVANLVTSFKEEDAVILQEVLSYCPKACAVKNNKGNLPVGYAVERQGVMDVFLKAAFTKNSIQ
ncbi:MAG: hypothetical protein AB7R69_02465 [Candidatus Babeliales bacterium]